MDDWKHLRWLEYADEKQRENNFKGFIFDDDKDKFVWFLNNPKMRCFTLLYWDILELISLVGAVNCATALLRGEVPLEVDINEPFRLGCYPIHHAAKRLDPPLVLLFLRHGARTDIKLNVPHPYHDSDNGLLPLNIAIKAASNHKRLQDWTPRRSIFDLIAILCHPELKDALETVSLLAMRTKELQKIAYHSYAKEGKPIELAILLMQMTPGSFCFIEFQSKDGSASDGAVKFSECINYEITSLMNEFKSTGATTLSQMLEDKMVAMRSMLLLLEVFDKAGWIIKKYKAVKPT
ncbi:hypothetical protein L1049_018847 [Liquidambar formosana]|uniref:Uncharacterized protein n=1 Tax=Liquidambar formosana TaxID=63359 RepID=A0AAP0RC61_LIQFO